MAVLEVAFPPIDTEAPDGDVVTDFVDVIVTETQPSPFVAVAILLELRVGDGAVEVTESEYISSSRSCPLPSPPAGGPRRRWCDPDRVAVAVVVKSVCDGFSFDREADPLALFPVLEMSDESRFPDTEDDAVPVLGMPLTEIVPRSRSLTPP